MIAPALEIATIIFVVYSFEYFLSGQVFPLDIFPAGLNALHWLPFTYEIFFPCRSVWSGCKAGRSSRLAIQAAWLVLTYLFARSPGARRPKISGVRG
jgi:ABC-2 type transport system permease protein